jgi:hypothetical protein
MLDLVCTQTTSLNISHLDRNSTSPSNNMSDFLNAFEAFLSSGPAAISEPDKDSDTVEGAGAEGCDMLDSPRSTVSMSGENALSPNDSGLPEEDRKLQHKEGIKMPPDKPETTNTLSLPTSSLQRALMETEPSGRLTSPLPEVPCAGPEPSCDRTSAVSDEKLMESETGSSVIQPLVPRAVVPQIKPIVPPIKLRKVDL